MQLLPTFQEQHLRYKLAYLNGYLESLTSLCNYSIIGFHSGLFLYQMDYMCSLSRTIAYNHYELNCTNSEDDMELVLLEDWKTTLIDFAKNLAHIKISVNEEMEGKHEAFSSIIKGNIVGGFDYFGRMLDELLPESTKVYEYKQHDGYYYRIIGIDLVFELGGTIDENYFILFLQINGGD